jgi:hypothetical protein
VMTELAISAASLCEQSAVRCGDRASVLSELRRIAPHFLQHRVSSGDRFFRRGVRLTDPSLSFEG